MKLVAVSLAHIEQAWVEVLPLMKKVVDSAPDLELSDMWNMLRSGVGELWLAGSAEAGTHAIAVTRMKRWGDETAGFIVLTSSDDSFQWRSVIPELCDKLRDRGATKIVTEGRRGISALLPSARIVRYIFEVDI